MKQLFRSLGTLYSDNIWDRLRCKSGNWHIYVWWMSDLRLIYDALRKIQVPGYQLTTYIDCLHSYSINVHFGIHNERKGTAVWISWSWCLQVCCRLTVIICLKAVEYETCLVHTIVCIRPSMWLFSWLCLSAVSCYD